MTDTRRYKTWEEFETEFSSLYFLVVGNRAIISERLLEQSYDELLKHLVEAARLFTSENVKDENLKLFYKYSLDAIRIKIETRSFKDAKESKIDVSSAKKIKDWKSFQEAFAKEYSKRADRDVTANCVDLLNRAEFYLNSKNLNKIESDKSKSAKHYFRKLTVSALRLMIKKPSNDLQQRVVILPAIPTRPKFVVIQDEAPNVPPPDYQASQEQSQMDMAPPPYSVALDHQVVVLDVPPVVAVPQQAQPPAQQNAPQGIARNRNSFWCCCCATNNDEIEQPLIGQQPRLH